MSGCDAIRDLLTPLLDGELDHDTEARVRDHLSECEECRELLEALELVAEAVAPLDHLEPPDNLADDLASSPCRRWLGLLFRAVDRELGEGNLNRLLSHLDSCESCRRAWNDLSLIHQVGDALVPPTHLLGRCISIRTTPRRRRVLGRHAASAAAFVLAALVSVAVGSPVTMAQRQQAADVVQRLADTVSDEVTDVTDDGRGELRVMLYRVWQWTHRQADTVKEVLHLDDNSDQEQQGG